MVNLLLHGEDVGSIPAIRSSSLDICGSMYFSALTFVLHISCLLYAGQSVQINFVLFSKAVI